MGINRVQFQKGVSMVEFMQAYGTEVQSYRSLYRSRWPKGFRSPVCGDRRRLSFRREGQIYYQCRACQHQRTLLSGTLLEATKLPLRTWFLAMHLLTWTKTNMAALELKRHLGVCYRTAWRLKHKILQAMTEREETRTLSGFVQIDDAYLGGEHNGGQSGGGSENKQAFVVAVETDVTLEHPLHAVIEPVRSFDNASMQDWARQRLAPEAEVFSDGLGAFRRFADAGHAHTVMKTEGGRAQTEVKGARWVNGVLGNVKRALDGVYHALKQGKYARRYLAEAAYRFNRRFQLQDILPRLLRAGAICGPRPERVLRGTTNFSY